MRRSLVTVVAAAGLVVAGCGSGSLPQLPLNAAGATNENAAGADMAMRVANVRYELAEGVKADQDTQGAYKQDGATRADAERIAKVFDVAGEVHADANGWTIGETKSLYVGKNGSWSMNGNTPVSSGVGCAAADGAEESCPTTTTTINPNLPSETEARKIAEDKLHAAGIGTDGMKVTVERFESVASVRFQPTFDGHAVDGYEYSLTVDADRSVAYANGYVGDMKSVGTYDLATLARAVERLNAQFSSGGGPAIDTVGMAAESSEPSSPESSEPTVVKLTAVRVGLMMTFDDADQSLWLTPAYVFKTDQDGGGEVTTAAADDKYLPPPTTVPPSDGTKPGATEPAPLPPDAGGNTGSGGGSTGHPGSVDPTPPTPSNCTSVSEPIAAQVCTDKATYKAGETVVFTITASDPDRAFTDGPCGDGVNVEYGDAGDGDVRCLACSTTVAEGPGKIQRQRTHTYAKAGTFSAKFTIKSGAECGEPHPNDSKVELSLPVRVS